MHFQKKEIEDRSNFGTESMHSWFLFSLLVKKEAFRILIIMFSSSSFLRFFAGFPNTVLHVEAQQRLPTILLLAYASFKQVHKNVPGTEDGEQREVKKVMQIVSSGICTLSFPILSSLSISRGTSTFSVLHSRLLHFFCVRRAGKRKLGKRK